MWFSLILFIAILFLYIHLQHQYKYPHDIQIYEIDYTSKKHFLDTCDARQPFVTNQEKTPNIPILTHPDLATYGQVEYHVKDIRDYLHAHTNAESNVEHVVLGYNKAKSLLDTDKQSRFFAVSQHGGISGHHHPLMEPCTKGWDILLKPDYCVYSKYETIFASKRTSTPFYYHNLSSKYLFVADSEVKVTMYPFDMHSVLEPLHNYETYEFWALPPNISEKPIEFWVYPRQILYIPPYCFYKIQFRSEKSVVCTAEYSTILNTLSNVKHVGLCIMQNQNMDVQFMKPLKQTLLDISNDDDHDDHDDDVNDNDNCTNNNPPTLISTESNAETSTATAATTSLDPAEELPNNPSTESPSETNLDKLSQTIIGNLKKE